MKKRPGPVHSNESSSKPERRRKTEERLRTVNPEAVKSPASLRRDLFRIDARSMAVFRMAMGVLLLADLAVRATDLHVMYTDGGMFSRAEICRRVTTIWNWSFHFASGSWGYQAMLFGLAAGLALALIIGFQTRLATIGSWLMLVSLHHRVPIILSGAELLLRMLLFWAMFLPQERMWSVDRWLDKRPRGPAIQADKTGVLSLASAAILMQMAVMYLFSAIPKTNALWLHGEAIAGILTHDFYASPASGYLLHFPRLLAVMTWGTLLLEWVAPFLLFSPKYTARLRIGVIAALATMHVGIAICLEVGLFSHVAMAGLTLFLPAEFWNSRLLARGSRSAEPEKQVGDGTKPIAAGRPLLPYFAPGLCLIALIYALALNLNTLPGHPLAPLSPETWKPLARGLGIAQGWGMFDAIPSRDGWYVGRAVLKDGSEVDLLRQGAPVDWTKPEFPARLYPNHYWQKIFREMAYDDEQGFQLFRAPVAEYLCRNWNARNIPGKQIAEFDFIYCMANKAEATNLFGWQISREQLVHLGPFD